MIGLRKIKIFDCTIRLVKARQAVEAIKGLPYIKRAQINGLSYASLIREM